MRPRDDTLRTAVDDFSPVTEVYCAPGTNPVRANGICRDGPVVYRGAVAHWPSVQGWSFDHLAAHARDMQVQLVQGNREAGTTVLEQATLKAYLRKLSCYTTHDAPGYLKEFDLLAALAELASQAPLRSLLPSGGLSSIRGWIGPPGSGTGLHRDLLHNVQAQVLGCKRWRFVRPGLVERLGQVSSKYDAWAVLASQDAMALRCGGHPQDFLWADLRPGDLITVPAGWWHEVDNLDATVAVAGFHGPALPVLTRWLGVTARQALHRLGWDRDAGCTCHSAP